MINLSSTKNTWNGRCSNLLASCVRSSKSLESVDASTICKFVGNFCRNSSCKKKCWLCWLSHSIIAAYVGATVLVFCLQVFWIKHLLYLALLWRSSTLYQLLLENVIRRCGWGPKMRSQTFCANSGASEATI